MGQRRGRNRSRLTGAATSVPRSLPTTVTPKDHPRSDHENSGQEGQAGETCPSPGRDVRCSRDRRRLVQVIGGILIRHHPAKVVTELDAGGWSSSGSSSWVAGGGWRPIADIELASP